MKSVLELGSGTGELSACIEQHHKSKMVLVDFSQEALDFSAKLFDALKKDNVFNDIAYIKSDVTKGINIADKSVDCVFSSGLLEHFSPGEQFSIIKESFRIARHRVFHLVPNANSIPYRMGKYFQQMAKTWKWGKETPVRTLKFWFRLFASDVQEFSICPHHALRFLNPYPEMKFAFEQLFMSLLASNELENLNQGYLLVTVGDIT